MAARDITATKPNTVSSFFIYLQTTIYTKCVQSLRWIVGRDGGRANKKPPQRGGWVTMKVGVRIGCLLDVIVAGNGDSFTLSFGVGRAGIGFGMIAGFCPLF